MRTKNISILVVEDEFIHRETIVNNLKELGISRYLKLPMLRKRYWYANKKTFSFHL